MTLEDLLKDDSTADSSSVMGFHHDRLPSG